MGHNEAIRKFGHLLHRRRSMRAKRPSNLKRQSRFSRVRTLGSWHSYRWRQVINRPRNFANSRRRSKKTKANRDAILLPVSALWSYPWQPCPEREDPGAGTVQSDTAW